jgi:transposase
MSISSASLPSDFASLQAFAITLQTTLQTRDAELQARDAELYAQALHIEKLKAQLALLRRARFGRSSEKLDHDIEQLELLIGDLEEGHAESEERTEAANPAAKEQGQRARTCTAKSKDMHCDWCPAQRRTCCRSLFVSPAHRFTTRRATG